MLKDEMANGLLNSNKVIFDCMYEDSDVPTDLSFCSVCVYQNYPCMGRFCELGVKLWSEWNTDKDDKRKPKIGEMYYFPLIYGEVIDSMSALWEDSETDNERYRMGVVCRTKSETVELARKMLAVAKKERKQDD